jgi:hypothetical protein
MVGQEFVTCNLDRYAVLMKMPHSSAKKKLMQNALANIDLKFEPLGSESKKLFVKLANFMLPIDKIVSQEKYA